MRGRRNCFDLASRVKSDEESEKSRSSSCTIVLLSNSLLCWSKFMLKKEASADDVLDSGGCTLVHPTSFSVP